MEAEKALMVELLAALQSFFKTWNVTDWWREGTRRNRDAHIEGRRQALLG